MSRAKEPKPTGGFQYLKWEDSRVGAKCWINGVEFEAMAEGQVRNLTTLPFVHGISIMPDAHWGMGATVGSVIATKGAICPASVGVDLGCGMVAVKTSLKAEDLPDNLKAIRSRIEVAVPHGRTNNGGPGDRGAWSHAPYEVQMSWKYAPTRNNSLWDRFSRICYKHPTIEKSNNVNHLGSLGTGNHFIEICLDDLNSVWVMLHSGSRGVGGKIGQYFINLAKEDMKRWFINLPDQDLAYLPEGSDNFKDYCEAVMWAQDFAATNRKLMLDAVLKVLAEEVKPFELVDKAINCHHNYIARENHFGENLIVTRKGAVRARVGDLGIIPGSMGAQSYIVSGKGNPDSYTSCSHGAGRKMSRTKAKTQFTLEDHAKATEGVECRKDSDVLDETPGAYKNIDKVMDAQADLVDIIAVLKQIVCVKG